MARESVGLAVKRGSLVIAALVGGGWLSGCEAQIGLETERKQTERTGAKAGSETEGAGSSDSSFEVKGASPLVAKPGEKIVVTGEGLTDGMTVRLGDGVTAKLTATSGETAYFTMPAGVSSNGAVQARLTRGDQENEFGLYSLVDDKYPLFTGPASEICSGIKYYDAKGKVKEGAKNCSGSSLPDCSVDGEEGCKIPDNPDDDVAAAVTTGVAAKLRSGKSVAGITGALADCSADGETDCVAVTDYPAADASVATAGNIKRGVQIAGEMGEFPSSSHPLPPYQDSGSTTNTASDGINVDLTTFITDLTSDGDFQYWDSSGRRRTGSGDSDIVDSNVKDTVQFENLSITGTYAGPEPDVWDLRYGVTVGSTTGKLKVNCRNMVGDYDKTDGLSNGISGADDPYSTVEDYNNGTGTAFPSTNPWGAGEYFCGFNDPTDPTWEQVTADGTASVYRDKINQLEWTRGPSTTTRDWDNAEGDDGANDGALEYCGGLNHDGHSDWRLPTQKELQSAYAHGIYDLDEGHTATDNLGDLDTSFWSSTTSSSSTSSARYVALLSGNTNQYSKTASTSVLCVRP